MLSSRRQGASVSPRPLLLCTSAAETNAAAHKPISLTGLSAEGSLASAADNNVSSCVLLRHALSQDPGVNRTAGARCLTLNHARSWEPRALAAAGPPCWPQDSAAPSHSAEIPPPAACPLPAGHLLLDLGYVGTVGALGGRFGARTTAGAVSRSHILKEADEAPSDANACGGESRQVLAGKWAVAACNKEGR